MMYRIVILLFLVVVFPVHAKDAESEIKPLEIGNLALPLSQRPNGLFSFGQTFADKGDLLLYLFPTDLHGCNKRFADIAAIITYGVSDSLSVTLTVPAAIKFKEDQCCSSGIEDLSLLAEYAFVERKHERSATIGTLVLSVFCPTGSDTKRPPTGLGSVSFLTGVTLTYWGVDWYLATCDGVIFTTKHNGIKHGNLFLYQFNIGRNIPSPEGWIFLGQVEFLGRQIGQDYVDCLIDCDTGSNTFSIAPSIWVSSERFTFQLGVSIPIHQQLAPMVKKENYTVAGVVGWKF